MTLQGIMLIAAEIDPAGAGIEKWVSLGIGGVLALLMFYFYRQLAAQSIDREVANVKAARMQTDMMVGVVQENSKVTSALVTTVDNLHRSLGQMTDELRIRYEQSLRDSVASAVKHGDHVAEASRAALAVLESAKVSALAVVTAAADEAERKRKDLA